MYEWSELIKLWELERLTTEQVIGQLLRHGEQSHRTIADTRRQLEILTQTLTTLTARVTTLEAIQAKRTAA